MKKFILVFVTLITAVSWGQNEYELNRDAETNRVQYQGVIENSGLSKAELYKLGIAYFESKGMKLDFQDESLGRVVTEATFSTIGKNNAYSKAYHYNFSCELTVEFKEGKTRYTFDNFMKKSSPGEPGSTLETFIENYQPKISSQKNRDRQAKMLDDIEIDIDSQIGDMIVDLKKQFGTEAESDW